MIGVASFYILLNSLSERFSDVSLWEGKLLFAYHLEDVYENIQGIYSKSILSTIMGVTQAVILKRGTQLSE